MRVLLATVLLLAVCATPAEAATLYSFTAQEVYVRNARGAFVIGTAKGPAFRPIPGLADTVLVQRYAHGRDWGYGLVSGHFPAWRGERCGWVHLQRRHEKFVRRISGGHKRGCHARGDQLTEPRLFRTGSYIHAAGAGSVFAAQIQPCGDLHAYGNYDPVTGQFTDPYPTLLPVGYGPSVPGFGQRYVTADGRAAMLKDSSHVTGGPVWYFVHADCVDRLASYMGEGRRRGKCCEAAGKGGKVRPYTLFLEPLYVIVLVKWHSWGGDVVRGKGLLIHNTCRPTCHAANMVYRHADLKLGRRRGGTCSGRAAGYYTRMSGQWRVPGTRHTKKFTRRLEPVCDTP